MLPAYVLPHHVPPPPAPPTLTVNAQGRVYPSKALLVKLRLRAGQPIDLLPPGPDCPSWRLDLRPHARRRITWHENTRPRIQRVSLPPGLVDPTAPLTLALVPTEPTSPGLYLLTPVKRTASQPLDD